MSNWFELIHTDSRPTLDAIYAHPFVQQLIHGELPQDTFRFYIGQDALYLAEFKRVLSGIANRASDSHDGQFYLTAASGILAVEEALHQMFLGSEPLPQRSPTCELYTGYLHRVLATQPVEVAMAATLPCFTIYQQVGEYIQMQQTTLPPADSAANPYQSWIDTYGSEEFAASVTQAKAITNRSAAATTATIREQMNHAYLKAAQLEWMFWDSALKQEPWPI